MAEDPRLEEAFRLIRAVVSDAYARGQSDETNRVLSLIAQMPNTAKLEEEGGDDADDNMDSDGRQRAPRGSVRKLIVRALMAFPEGLTTSEIMDLREGDLELMIKSSSVRSELRKGAAQGEFKEEGGRWKFDVLFSG